MSGFKSNSKVVNWIEDRLPIFSLMQHSAVEYPTPKNLEVPEFTFVNDTLIRIG
jgi:hypothetical protein